MDLHRHNAAAVIQVFVLQRLCSNSTNAHTIPEHSRQRSLEPSCSSRVIYCSSRCGCSCDVDEYGDRICWSPPLPLSPSQEADYAAWLQSGSLHASNSIRVAVHITLKAREIRRSVTEQEIRTRLRCIGQVTGQLFKHFTLGSRGRVNAVVYASVRTAIDADAALKMFNDLHRPAFHANLAHPHIPRGGRGNHPHLPKPGGVFNPKNHALIRRCQKKHSNRKKR